MPEINDTAAPDVSIDQLIAEAEAASPKTSAPADADVQTASADDILVDGGEATPPADAALASNMETAETADTTAEASATSEDAQTEPEAPAEDSNRAVERARKILHAANRKEKEARESLANVHRDLSTGLRSNPKATLAKLGLTIDELIDASLNEGNIEAPKEADRITMLERELQAQREAREIEAASRQVEEAKAKVLANVKGDKRFAQINRTNNQDLVTDFMVEYWQTHGKPIPWDQAAQLVEKNLRALAGIPDSAPSKAPPQRAQATSKPAARNTTLTNNEVRTSIPDDAEPTDPDELLRTLVSAAERKNLQAR